MKAQRQRDIPTVWFWASDFGDIQLPIGFPIEIFRKDGWWDMRFKAFREKWEAWIAAEEAKLRTLYLAVPLPEVPNRLHGAAINAEGDAI